MTYKPMQSTPKPRRARVAKPKAPKKPRTQSAIGRSSKAKGARFELELAKSIQEAFGVDKTECYRTPMSGGHHANRQAADLTLSVEMQKRFPWVLEAKHRIGLTPAAFLSSQGKVVEFFRQVLRTAERANQRPEVPGLTYRPLLVAKANFGETWAVFPIEYMTEVLWYKPHFLTIIDEAAWVGVTWEDFLNEAKDGNL